MGGERQFRSSTGHIASGAALDFILLEGFEQPRGKGCSLLSSKSELGMSHRSSSMACTFLAVEKSCLRPAHHLSIPARQREQAGCMAPE